MGFANTKAGREVPYDTDWSGDLTGLTTGLDCFQPEAAQSLFRGDLAQVSHYNPEHRQCRRPCQ